MESSSIEKVHGPFSNPLDGAPTTQQWNGIFIFFLIKNFSCLPSTKLASRSPSQRIDSHLAFFRSVNRQLLIALHRCKVMKKYASPIWWMDGRWLWVCTLDNCIGFSVRKRDGKKRLFVHTTLVKMFEGNLKNAFSHTLRLAREKVCFTNLLHN